MKRKSVLWLARIAPLLVVLVAIATAGISISSAAKAARVPGLLEYSGACVEPSSNYCLLGAKQDTGGGFRYVKIVEQGSYCPAADVKDGKCQTCKTKENSNCVFYWEDEEFIYTHPGVKVESGGGTEGEGEAEGEGSSETERSSLIRRIRGFFR